MLKKKFHIYFFVRFSQRVTLKGYFCLIYSYGINLGGPADKVACDHARDGLVCGRQIINHHGYNKILL